MSGFGFGFGSKRNSSARFVALNQSNPLPLLFPSSQWIGAAGNGFVAVPNDPVRTTAKPTLRLLVAPNQYYTDELLVGVMAGANYRGSLIANLGLRRVVVHYEGNSRSIDAPSFQSFADANGNYRTYFGWWTILRNDGRHGHAQIYFEAVPNDPEMQNRIEGPYQFSPQPALHDAAMTVAANGPADFQSIAAALAHCRTNAFNNPLVSIVEAGNYDIADGAQAYEGQGYCTITATVAGVRIAKPGYADDAAAVLRPGYGGLRFKGANLSIDMQHISEIFSEPGATRFHWMDGCTIVNSAGQGALWRGVTRPADWIVRDGAWFTECSVQECSDAFRLAKLVRGTTEVNGTKDLYAGCPTVVGNVSTRHRSDTTLAKDIPAISVRYTGTAATATLKLAGGNSLATRTVTVTLAGSADRTFTLEKSEAAYQADTNYTLQHLVTWLSAIPGMTATLLDSTSGRAAAWLSLADLAGNAFSAQDIKSAALTLVTYVDVQSNWWEAGALNDNVIVWGNIATGQVARDFNLAGSAAKRDFLFANNAIQNDKGAVLSVSYVSEMDGANSHVVIAHNTLSTQSMILRSDLAYMSGFADLLANNSVSSISWGGAPATTPIVNNHIHAGQTPPASAAGQTNVTGTTIGGDDGSLYVNDRGADFSAVGVLATSLAPSVLRFNANGEVISATDVKGAFKAGTQLPVTHASSVTQYGITYNFSEPRPVAQYEGTGDWQVLGPVTITSMEPASVQASGLYTDAQSPYSSKWINGAQVNPGNRSWATGGLVANNKDNLPQGLDQIPSLTNYKGFTYSHANNQDPGATGAPLVVATGSVMKFVSLIPPNIATRPGGTDMAVLTVVDTLSAPNSLRPGVAQVDKTHHFTTDDLDPTIFPNFPRPPGMPTPAEYAASVIRPAPEQFIDSVNTENAHAINNRPNYVREWAKVDNTALLSLCFQATDNEKLAILIPLANQALDILERRNEGGDAVSAGSLAGANAATRRKAILCVVTAALKGAANRAKLAELEAACDYEQNGIFQDDKNMRVVDFATVATPRDASPSRPLDPYGLWMEGSVDFTGGGSVVADGGSNQDAGYRQVSCGAGILGVAAVVATPGALALWNRGNKIPEYYKAYRAAETRQNYWGSTGSVNNVDARQAAMIEAAWPADPAPPAPVDAKAQDDTLWVRFDKTLDQQQVVDPANWNVTVNGSPVTVTRAPAPIPSVRDAPNQAEVPPPGGYTPNGIFRTNAGLILPSPVVSTDTVTVAYTGSVGTGRLRSNIDLVEVAAFAALAAENLTPSVGGVNASYPVVAFGGTDRLQVTGDQIIAPFSSPLYTLALLDVKWNALPSAHDTVFIFGFGSSGSIVVTIRSTGAIEVATRNGTSLQSRVRSSSGLSAGVSRDIIIAADITDPTAATGANLYVNGVSASINSSIWGGGAGKKISWNDHHDHEFGHAFNGEIGAFWLLPGVRLPVADIGKFRAATNGSLDIGTLGDGITGTQPPIFLAGNAQQWNNAAGINLGTGPKFYRNSGGVVDVSGALWR